MLWDVAVQYIVQPTAVYCFDLQETGLIVALGRYYYQRLAWALNVKIMIRVDIHGRTRKKDHFSKPNNKKLDLPVSTTMPTLVMTANADNGDNDILEAGDSILYTMEISNTGNTCLLDVETSDLLVGAAIHCDTSSTGGSRPSTNNSTLLGVCHPDKPVLETIRRKLLRKPSPCFESQNTEFH